MIKYVTKRTDIMNLLGVIRDNNYLEYLDNGLDGLILPLENFSVDYFKYYSISDIREYRKIQINCYL